MKFVIDIINEISSKIQSHQNAWYILETITKKNKSELIRLNRINLTLKKQKQIDYWIDEYLNNHMPLQYIIGNVPFINSDILVQKPVLIPRPETEYWCYHIIEKLNTLKNTKINILDIGTGSGCIAIAIAKAFPLAKLYAIDISDEAISLTKKNVIKNKVKNIKIIKSNLFEKLFGYKFDLIVSNPPYIDEKIYNNLDLSVKNWEDKNALLSSDNGLHLIKLIIKEAKNFLCINSEFEQKNIPQIIIEIDSDQSDLVKKYLKDNSYSNIKIGKDLAKRDRFVTARR